jgi:hypothetical protein|tara:strand:+ start:1465 stop:1866 length:402 start_codon:yes stop_codon:yes gene_type:complete
MYSELNDVFEEAVNDHASRRLNGSDEDAMLSCGIKIVRYHEDDNIEIYNTAKGGDYYKEIEEDEYNLFFDNGWVAGVCKMSLKKYKERLETIKNKMKDEINGRNNAKYISFLKDTIRTTMNKYYNTTQKLNKL